MWERSDPNVTGYQLPLERYKFALRKLGNASLLIADAAFGCGYGTDLLTRQGERVVGFDVSDEALAHARSRAYQGGFVLADIGRQTFRGFDALVCLETIEHLYDPFVFVKNLDVKFLVISTTVVEPENNDEWHKHTFNAEALRSLITPKFRILDELTQDEPCGINGFESYLTLYAERS